MVYGATVTRTPTFSLFATAWLNLLQPTMYAMMMKNCTKAKFDFQAVRKWIPEVNCHRPETPVVLVATQASRNHLNFMETSIVYWCGGWKTTNKFSFQCYTVDIIGRRKIIACA